MKKPITERPFALMTTGLIMFGIGGITCTLFLSRMLNFDVDNIVLGGIIAASSFLVFGGMFLCITGLYVYQKPIKEIDFHRMSEYGSSIKRGTLYRGAAVYSNDCYK